MDTLAALADQTRRIIIEMIARRGEMTATDISDNFTVSASAISQHLKVLKETNLVHMEKRVQKSVYTIKPKGIRGLDNWTHKMLRMWNERFDALKSF